MSGEQQTPLRLHVFKAGHRLLHVAPIAVLCIGTALSFTLFSVLQHQQQLRAIDDFQQISRDRIAVVDGVLALDLLRMRGLQSFCENAREIGRGDFASYLRPIKANRPSIQAMEWVPRVSESRRRVFEEKVAQEGMANYRITSCDRQGNGELAPRPEEHFPILYVEPSCGNVAALGSDLATDPKCRNAMDSARDTGSAVATPPVRINGKAGGRTGVRVFFPVYEKDARPASMSDRRKSLRGFVVGVIRIRGLVEASLAMFSPAGIDFQFVDTTDPGERRILYTHLSRMRDATLAADNFEDLLQQSKRVFADRLNVAGRQWTVACAPIPAFLAARTRWQPWGVAASGLLLTVLLALYLSSVSSQNARATRLATELAESNRRLQRESAERKQADTSLRTSQVKYRAIYELSTDAIMVLTPEDGFLAGNAATVALYGCKDEAEFASCSPADLSPEYQPDGSLSSEKAQKMMALAMEEGSHGFHWQHKRKDGREFMSLVTLTRMELEGKPFLQATVRDITEQQRTQEAFKAGQERLRLFLENVSDVVWTMDFSGVFTYMSPSMQQMLGHRWEEEARLTIADILTPASLTSFLKTLKDIVSEAYTKQRVKTRIQEVELLRKDGSAVWSELTINGLRNEAGEIEAIQGIARDISERKEAEEKQSRLVRRLQGVNRLQEGLLLPGSLADKFKKITQTAVDLLDLDFCRIWMTQPGDLCQRGCIHAAADDEAHTCRHREACLHLMASSGRYTHLGGDHRRVPLGSYKIGRIASDEEPKFLTNDVTTDPRVHDHQWAKDLGLVSFGGYKLRDPDNRPIGVLAMFAKHPISEEDDAFLSGLAEVASRVIIEEKTANALAQENAKLSAMISGMEECVAFADANDVIVEVSPFLCQFMNRKREELIGRRIEEVHGGDTWRRISAAIDRFRPEPGSPPLVLQRAINGVEAIVRMQPIYRDGAYDGLLLNIIDVSELVESRRHAEEASQAKSRFLASISHEIRTPMTAILGYADLMMDPSINASSQNNYAAVIRRNGEQLLTLIDDILDLSKIEAGKLAPEMHPCNVVALLADVASAVIRAEQRKISLSIEYPGALPETILTDALRLRQAIVNLVGNAVKFTRQGGVRVVASLIEGFCGDQPALRIDVIDTGIGIRPDILASLFQPFVQGDPAIHKEFGGTGLGLAISHQIARLLGGDLTVDSALGRGSTFTLTVPTGALQNVHMLQHPAEIALDATSHVYAPPSDGLRAARVLLAEDGYDNRELICRILRKAGAEVEYVENGRQAIAKVENRPFDVVLMDMNMPEMDGYQATRLLRSQGYSQPILALTANAMSDDKQRCKESGCNEYLSKPVDRAELIAAIARYTGHKLGTEAGADPTPAGAPAPATDSPDREETMVSEFRDDPEMAEILGEFVGRLDGQVRAMREAYDNDRYEELQRLGHRLKGAGGSYGYPQLTAAGKQLEEAVKARDFAAAKTAIDCIAGMCKAVVNGFAQANPVGRTTS